MCVCVCLRARALYAPKKPQPYRDKERASCAIGSWSGRTESWDKLAEMEDWGGCRDLDGTEAERGDGDGGGGVEDVEWGRG